MLVTALKPHIGYEKAAKIAQMAHREGARSGGGGRTGVVTADEFDAWVRPEEMTHPLPT